MKKLVGTIVLLIVIFFLSATQAQVTKEGGNSVLPGEIRLEATAIHPFFRTEAFPSNTEVDMNPVVFYWPSTRQNMNEKLLSYDFQLSSSDKFQVITDEVKNAHPSFYASTKKLNKGIWYWRYREVGKEWCGPYSFSIGENTAIDGRPSAQTFINNINDARPRIVIRKDRLSETRKNFAKAGITATIVKEVEKYFDVVLPDKEWGGKFYKNGKRVFKQGKFPDDHIKAQITGPIWNGAVTNLCRAYLLTQDERYADEALRWGMKVSTFPILPSELAYDGNPYPDCFDFAFYLDVMAYMYDALYDRMSLEQREIVRKNIAERLSVYYNYYCNRIENRCIDNHTWQLSLSSFVRASIIAKGDIPEADTYLAYVYDVWKARDPEQSHTDGGWFGGGYVNVNIGVWTEVPIYFKRYTGYNFYNHPFYKNHPLWFLYRQFPGSKEDGFSGDGYGDDEVAYSPNLQMWLNILDADLDIPEVSLLTADFADNKKYETFAWARRVEGMPMRKERTVTPKIDIPQARAFRDIGVANMHTDVLHPQNDIHVAFRSSPYGTFGHNLANHNAFTVLYKGEYLFVPYGHRHGGAKNSTACYRHTRGHNSVLVDGKGQPFSPEAYGWIARFLHGDKVSYVCGDASNAYDAQPFGRENEFFESAGLKIEDHISRGKVNRFRRHLLFVRPSLVIVYDELEAKEPVSWDWVLHCRNNMTADGSKLSVENVNAMVDVHASTPMLAKVETKPMFMPINVDGRGGENAGEPYPVKGSYAYVSTQKKTDKLRIVTFVQVGDNTVMQELSPGVFKYGDWKIEVEMDPSKMANIKLTEPNVSFLMKTPDTGESVLRENIGGKQKEFRTIDELPYSAKGLRSKSTILTK